MANVIIDDTHLTNIADAIRSKNGSVDTYTPAQMAAAISAIETGGSGNNLYLEEQPLPQSSTSLYKAFKRRNTTPAFIHGIGKQSSDSFRTIVDELTHHTFIIVTSKADSDTGTTYYYQMIYTPSGYQYCKQQGYHWWGPTYVLRQQSGFNNQISYSHLVYNSTAGNISSPLMQNLITLCFSIDEMELDAAISSTTKNVSLDPSNGKVDLWLYYRRPTSAANSSTSSSPNMVYAYYSEFKFLMYLYGV